tara:strand:+ start:510 stop:1826 length:1317 start_codon:yes stop_codon:yes gene_type:complete
MLLTLLVSSTVVLAKDIFISNATELEHALREVAPGDSLLLSPGHYPLQRTVSRIGGTQETPITIKAIAPGSVIIDAENEETFVIYHPYWIFEGLIIEGTDTTNHAFHLSLDADYVVIRNTTIRNFHNHIKVNGKHDRFPDHILIEKNRLTNDTVRKTARPASPIDIIGGTHAVIRGNLITDFSRSEGDQISYGLFIKGNSSFGMIEQNLVVCSAHHSGGYRIGISLGGGGTAPSYCENQDCSIEHRSGVIRNNIVMNCSDAGIFLKKASGSQILHNTLIQTSGIDIQLKGSSATIVGNYIDGDLRARKGAQYRQHNNLIAGKSSTAACSQSHPLISDLHHKANQIVRWITNQLGVPYPSSALYFQSALAGNLRPFNPQQLTFSATENWVSHDFSGHPRNPTKHWFGAIDFNASPCDISLRVAASPQDPPIPCIPIDLE